MLFMRKDDLFYESSGHYCLHCQRLQFAVADDDDE